jgi:cytochrome oxidase Cu insertion factor (SCO1/SenC/PrrC family)
MKMPATSSPSRLRLRHILGWLGVVLAVSLAAGWVWYFTRGQANRRPDSALQGLQVFGSLQDFSLTDPSRRTITRADLLGTVWVANFIYTRCTDTCPLQSARMAALQRDFPDERGLRFLSITVDPRRDTPAVLDRYASRYEADRERWWFLTGDKQAIYTLIQEGFRLNVEDPTDSASPAPPSPDRRGNHPRPLRPLVASAGALERMLASWLAPAQALAHSDAEFLAPPFLHSSWFVLGDRRAQIRGYYKTEDEQAMRQLRRDIRALLAEP